MFLNIFNILIDYFLNLDTYCLTCIERFPDCEECKDDGTCKKNKKCETGLYRSL